MPAAATSAQAEPFEAASVCAAQPSMLHVFPSFGIGGVPLRMCRVINHFSRRFCHTIVALDGNFDAAGQLSSHIDISLITPIGRKSGLIYDSLAAAMMVRQIKPDLLITYNWGSIEWAIANRILQRVPHIHFEAGFGREEADTQLRRRVLCRRWALARCIRIVVPSRRLEMIARQSWCLPADSIFYLPNGVDVERFSIRAHDAQPGFARHSDELIIGTVAPLRPEKNIARLLRVFAMLDTTVPTRLVIAGEGTERNRLENFAREIGIADRVTFTGQVFPEAVLGSFDIFALSSDTEQMPNAVLEAMAARLPIAAVDVGDIKMMVSQENREFIAPRDSEAALFAAIRRLLDTPALREQLGKRNRERVVAEFSLRRMFDRYAELFLSHDIHRQHKNGYGRFHSGP